MATSISIRGSIAQRSCLFDALLSAIRPRLGATGAGGKSGGGPGGSPPQAVACAAFCLAHVTTGESAALLTRRKIVAALLALSCLLDACIDQIEAENKKLLDFGAAQESKASSGSGLGSRSLTTSGTAGGGRRDGGMNTLPLMKSTGTALWGCLSHLSGMYKDFTLFDAATTLVL